MNALIKKEIRLIFPAWVAAIIIVAILPYLFLLGDQIPYNPDSLPMPFMLGILFLSLASFGQEFSHKTFPILLSQPVPRNRIWLAKIAVLATAFASVLLILFVCYKIYFCFRPVYNIPFPAWILILFGFVIFSGGLWTTLLLRQVTGAFWFTILTPAILFVLLFAFSEHFHWSQHVNNLVVPAMLSLYSIAGFFWARKMFLSAQDTQWTGGEISFSWRRKISERTVVSSQPRHWFLALVRKEIQLHQVNILIAVIVLALHLTSAFIRKVHPNFENPNLKFILETIWVLWLAMPLLIGSAAVAEERKLGILELQLCLPVSRRAQLFIKFSVALVLSLVLGGVMPFVIERTRDLNLWIFVVAALIFYISFYASTLARTMLQAIGLAIAVTAVIYLYEVSTALGIFKFGHYVSDERLGIELLKLYLGGPILLVTISWLAARNFKWLHENWKLWRRNFFVVLGAFATIFILTNGIYFRAWELLTPIEPPHSVARLNNSTEVKLVTSLNTLYAKLPDGRLWVETLAFDHKTNRWFGDWDAVAPDRSTIQFLSASNWIEVAVDDFQALGIQSDGGLWSLQRQWNPSTRRWWQKGSFEVNAIGSEKNWSQAAGKSMGFLLLKKDGSLWVWGTNGYNWRDSSNSIPKKMKLDLITPPARIGAETNWTELFSSRNAYAKKKDGSIWEWNDSIGTNHVSAMIQNTNFNGQWLNFVAPQNRSVGVKTNGELWFFEEVEFSSRKTEIRKTQLGQNAKWKVAAFAGWDTIVAIRNDGTLWKWQPAWNLFNNPDLIKPVQLGNHSDWITVPSMPFYGAFALADDGSLWDWNEPSEHRWLAPSRKPVFVGNIFESATSK